MVHDAVWSGEDQVTELTRWQKIVGKLLNASERNVKTWRDDTGLVHSANEIHHNLAGTVVIHDFQVANVSVLLHHLQELDDHLRAWPDKDLTFSSLLSIDNAIQAVTEHTDSHHCFLSSKVKTAN